MRVLLLRRYSPARGQRLEAGTVVEVADEVALDLIQQGVAAPLKREPPEMAVGPGQARR